MIHSIQHIKHCLSSGSFTPKRLHGEASRLLELEDAKVSKDQLVERLKHRCHQAACCATIFWQFSIGKMMIHRQIFVFFSLNFQAKLKSGLFPSFIFCARIVFTTGFHDEIFWWNESVRSWAKSESNDTWFHYISLCFNMFQWHLDVHDISGN